MIAAIIENRSTHCDMFVMGIRAGAGGRPGSLGDGSSVVISAISTNSRSRIFLTSFVGKDAVGLNGPGVEMDRAAEEDGVVGPFGIGGDAAAAAAARISNPEGIVWDVEKSGNV